MLPSSPRARRAAGAAIGLAAVGLVYATLGPVHAHLGAGTPGLVLVLPVVAAGVIGGVEAALVVAIGATLVYLVGFIPPVGSLRVDVPADIVVLATFTTVAAVVGTLVARSESRRAAAEQRAVELAQTHEKLAAAEAERSRLLVESARARALEELDRQRTALVRSVSHDLRTPLVTIRAVATDLVAGTVYDPPTTTRLLQLVATEADRLDRLVTNLLDMSRIEAGAFAPKIADQSLVEIIEVATARLDTVLGDVRLTTDIPDDLPGVLADHAQLGQVLTNLIENALRHSPPDGVVEISARAQDAHVVVSVRDHGPGLSGVDVDHLFEPFVSTSTGHSGLGLAICRAIVEAHAGTIDARDEFDGGATFSFTLPVAP
jgi:two-component system sensor histidine kinase KdpD